VADHACPTGKCHVRSDGPPCLCVVEPDEPVVEMDDVTAERLRVAKERDALRNTTANLADPDAKWCDLHQTNSHKNSAMCSLLVRGATIERARIERIIEDPELPLAKYARQVILAAIRGGDDA
jgi:hypothetical protein